MTDKTICTFEYDCISGRTGYLTRVTDLAVPLKATEVINQSFIQGTVNQNGTVYIDNKEYNTLNGNPALTSIKRIYNAEGYVEDITLPIPNYYYFRRDHLGNNREVWLANTNTTVQRTQYYPSGLPWASNTGDNPGLQERKYNGKEFVEMHGYDTYDYGARGYYAAVGRFMCVDPHAERYYSISPYAYCEGNPINAIDPNGKDKKPATDKTTAIDNTSTTVPVKIQQIPIKQLTPMQQAVKTAQSQPKGEIKAAQTTAQKSYNSLSDFDKQALQSPVINSVAVGGLVTMAVVAAPLVATTAETTINTTAIAATNIIESSVVSTVAAGAIEGIFKGVTNTPPEITVPYLNSTPLYQTSSDFFNSLATIFMNNLPNTNQK